MQLSEVTTDYLDIEKTKDTGNIEPCEGEKTANTNNTATDLFTSLLDLSEITETKTTRNLFIKIGSARFWFFS